MAISFSGNEPGILTPGAAADDDPLQRYGRVRARSEELCRPLALEDYAMQSMADVSPPKWHLAHTSWFFEEFILKHFVPDYAPFHPRYAYLFNSYYQTVGAMHPRARRGLLSRPATEEIFRYRAHVNEAMQDLLQRGIADGADLHLRVDLGLNHEQQHQELLLTDIKHIFAANPLRPAYRDDAPPPSPPPAEMQWTAVPGGVYRIGHDGPAFAFDNERPRHRQYLEPCCIASRLVTNGEYLAFMSDGGYGRAELWLSNGWEEVRRQAWEAPLYWERDGDRWWHMTLHGMRPVDPNAPVCHVSFYEADAFARWRGARLPTEAEWEVAASAAAVSGNFYERGRLQPYAAETQGPGPAQCFGDVWEWTQSPYGPYPGFRPLGGSLGEYNGKFMCNQLVLRGGSCATPASHMRATYRNFFYAADRWQFSGIRLAMTP